LESRGGSLAAHGSTAPDQPGHILGSRVTRTPDEGDEKDEAGNLRPGVNAGGEADWKIVKAAEKAATQLPVDSDRPAVICVCPNRSAFASTVAPRLSHLVGNTEGGRGPNSWSVRLRKKDRGAFWTDDWARVSGVMVLELLRPDGNPRYKCVVLLNPNAKRSADTGWFGHAHVLVKEGNRSNWHGGEAVDSFYAPNETLCEDAG
jgi:hypothetical protein